MTLGNVATGAAPWLRLHKEEIDRADVRSVILIADAELTPICVLWAVEDLTCLIKFAISHRYLHLTCRLAESAYLTPIRASSSVNLGCMSLTSTCVRSLLLYATKLELLESCLLLCVRVFLTI